jgi:S-DNA-T family DNA segregation ATPase FtsK/SpoIIIE
MAGLSLKFTICSERHNHQACAVGLIQRCRSRRFACILQAAWEDRFAAMSSTSERTIAGVRRFASPAVKAALWRRLAEFAGILCALAGLALLLALLSHDPADPSLSTATGRAPANVVGQAGASASDLLLQGFGYAGALPVLALLAWAFRLGAHRGLGLFPARLAALLAALPALAATISRLPLPVGQPVLAGPGGAVGPVLAEFVTRGAQTLFGGFGLWLAYALLALTAFCLSIAAFGLSPAEWLGLGRFTRRGAVGVARAGSQGVLRGTRLLQGRRLGLFARVAGLLRRPPRQQQAGADLTTVLEAAEQKASAGGRRRLAPPPIPEPPRDPVPEQRKVARVVEAVRPGKRPETRQPELPLAGAGPFRLPPLELLAPAPIRRAGRPSDEALQANARLLEQVLEDYGVRGHIGDVRPGPVVTLYELEPAPGTKSSRVIGLADDIARSMSVLAVRIATVPGRNVIGIEMPNANRETVFLSEMFSGEEWAKNSGKLPLALGKDIGGAPVIADLARMPHLLIAGTTGSGKSVAINTMILSLLYRFSPEECRFIMIDPKMLELSVYDRIPHLLAPVVTEAPKAIGALKWTVREMEKRYRAMSNIGVRNIGGYNEKVAAARGRGEVLTRRVQTGFDPETGKPVFEELPLALEPLPMIVVVIDEMADLMIVAGKEIEAAVQRLAQMARAAGIHVIMATQRPSVDVITGVIKANFPTRISFSVTSKIDSRTILGEQGAEQLLGQGDMLHMAGGGRVARVHGPFVSDIEVERIVEHLREQGEPAYIEEVTEAVEDAEGGDGGGLSMSGIAGASDADKSLFDKAVDVVSREGKATTSFLQRQLRIGYNRAADLIEQMEKEGIVGPANHVGKREVLTRRRDEDED